MDALGAGTTDYSVTVASGLYEAPPSGSSPLASSTASSVRVDLPFEFPYFGVLYDHVRVTIGGYLVFGNESPSATVIAVDPSTVAAGASHDGACAPLWVGLSTTALTSTYGWTAGTAPNRRFVVSFEDVTTYAAGSARMTFQVRLFEGSGRIEFAYEPDSTPSTWTGLQYSIGMVAPGSDPRWHAPVNSSTTNSGHPGNDFRMEPRGVRWSGRLLYERLEPTADGLGATPVPAPFAGLELTVYTSDGRLAARGATGADGSFDVAGFAGPAGASVDVAGHTRGAACDVRSASADVPHVRKLVSALDASADAEAGTRTLDAASDPDATFRAPANIARAIERAHAWVAQYADTEIPSVVVRYDPASASATSYSPGGTSTPATMTVAGPASANPDAWDDAAIVLVYSRHVLEHLAARPTTPADPGFDAATDPQNAFAAGFGHFLHAAATGESTWIDSLSASSSDLRDLEDPQPQSARAPDVAAWVAAALHDLLDAANEPHDWVDGSNGVAGRVVEALEALSAPADAVRFHESWAQLGFEGLGLARCFVAHGLLVDDAFEPNDAAAESGDLGASPLRRDGLVLQIGSEDWFDLRLDEAVQELLLDLSFKRGLHPATVELQLLSAAGSPVAGKVDAGLGPVQVTAGPLPAGDYRVRAAHVSGVTVPAYTLQACTRVALSRTALPPWTVGIPYDQPIPLSGGIPPLELTAENGAPPTGIVFDAQQGRARGTPVTVGTFGFSLVARDSGDPVHTDIASHQVVINDVLGFDFGPFFPFAFGRGGDVAVRRTGGTAPLVVQLVGGALPPGVSIAQDDLRFGGAASAAGSFDFAVNAVDVAGSGHEAPGTAVVCVPLDGSKTAVDLAGGAAACGVFVDAVLGSTVSGKVATAPKRAKRTLSAFLLMPDGSVPPGAKAKAGKGRASASLAAVPASGRYFLVFATDAGDATQLLASAVARPPRRGKGSLDAVGGGERISIPIGALEGARLQLTAKPARGTDLDLSALSLVSPSGAAVPLGETATVKGSSVRIDTELGASGTWTLLLRADGSGAGRIQWKFRLVSPKGAAYTVD